ncbi:hypothetical protein [Mycoplasmopsis pulmonis]|uniref:hypothetical protein n=1 Tax=Mycoplasmopsis pulmonis TaxID=2107 RepID=UPI001004F4A1|nr:hypothetical protein [Mycoplasmopsis pulmonis]VEU68180.1 lipoprotein [Mycoplasmopsis pulmonis]
MRKKLIITLLTTLAIVPMAVVSCTFETGRENENGQNTNNQQAQPDQSKPNTNQTGSGSNQTTPPPVIKPESPAKPQEPKAPEAKQDDPKSPETPQPPVKPNEEPKAPETKPEDPTKSQEPKESEKKVVDKKLVIDKIQELSKFANKHKELLTTLTSEDKLKKISLDSYAKEFEQLSKLDEEFIKFYTENKYIFESDVALKELNFAPIKTDEWINDVLPAVKIAKKIFSSFIELKTILEEYYGKVFLITQKKDKLRIESIREAVEVAKKGYGWLTQGLDLTNEKHKELEMHLIQIYEKLFPYVKQFGNELAITDFEKPSKPKEEKPNVNPKPSQPKEEKPIDLKQVLISKEEVEDWIQNQEIYSLDNRIKSLSHFNGRTFDSTLSYNVFKNYIVKTIDGSSYVKFTNEKNVLYPIYKQVDFLSEEHSRVSQSTNKINAFWLFQWRDVTKNKETDWHNLTVHTRTDGENRFTVESHHNRNNIENLSKLSTMNNILKAYIRVSYINVAKPTNPVPKYKPAKIKPEVKKPDWRLVSVNEINTFVREVKKYSSEEQLRRAAQFGHVTFENRAAVKIFTDYLQNLLKSASIAYIDKDGNLLERQEYKFEEYYYDYKNNLANAYLVVQWSNTKKEGKGDNKTTWWHHYLKGTQRRALKYSYWTYDINKVPELPQLGPDHHFIWFNYYNK